MSKQKKRIIILTIFLAVIIAIRYSPVGTILTFDNLQQHRNALFAFVQDHYGLSVILFLLTYICTTALSIPGATILTLAGGFLFGTAIATVCINVGATTGATLAFLSARYLLGERLQERYQSQLLKFNAELEKNGSQYLLTLRFIPAFPFFLINFLSGLTKIPIKTFVWTTSIGIIPGTLVYTFAGKQIGSINSLSEILSTKVLVAFVLLALFAIMPVIINRIKGSKQKNGT